MRRNYNLDLIRIFACISVLVLHIFGVKGGYLNTITYLTGTLGIPLFFMMSGYNMLSKKRQYSEILLKILNIYIFLLIFCFIGGILYTNFKHLPISSIPELCLGVITTKGVFAILWFMVALTFLYLMTPILYKYRTKKYFLQILFGGSSIIFISNIILVNNFGITIKDLIPQTLRIWTWISYYMLGYYLSERRSLILKPSLSILIIITIIAVNYEYFIGKILFHNVFAEIFYDSIVIKIWSITLWSFIMRHKIMANNTRTITIISKTTFSIYILQVPLLIIVNQIIKDKSNILINLIAFICSGLSLFIISYMITKTKYINRFFELKIIGGRK